MGVSWNLWEVEMCRFNVFFLDFAIFWCIVLLCKGSEIFCERRLFYKINVFTIKDFVCGREGTGGRCLSN